MPSHVERRHLPYTARQFFDLVADIERYPDFIEQFVAARILRRDNNILEVEQTVQFGGFRLRFRTRAVLDPPHRILVSGTHPLFSTFDQQWTFTPAPHGGTVVEYKTCVELRSRLVQGIAGALVDERRTAEDIVSAFTRRAHRIYGAGLSQASSGRHASTTPPTSAGKPDNVDR